MIGLGAATPSNRLRRQVNRNIYEKSEKTVGGFGHVSTGGGSSDGSTSGRSYGSTNNDNGNRYDSDGANYGDKPPTVADEQYNNPYSVNLKEGDLLVSIRISQ